MLTNRITGLVVLGIALLVVFAFQGSVHIGAESPTPTAAVASCNTILASVIKNVSSGCNSFDPDQVCYGNTSVALEYQNASIASQIPFTKPGDVMPMRLVKSITTGPLDPVQGQWGIAVLKTAASVPGVTGGQAVTFLLYGDTSIKDVQPASAVFDPAPPSMTAVCSATTARVTYIRANPGPIEQQVQLLKAGTTVNIIGKVPAGDWLLAENEGRSGWVYTTTLNPGCDLNKVPVVSGDTNLAPAGILPSMRAFYFSTGVGAQAVCNDVPSGGLVVQNPDGQKITFKANGADITIASEVLMQAVPNQKMTFSVYRGHLTARYAGRQETITNGQSLSIPLGGLNGLQASGPPTTVQPMQTTNLNLDTVCNVSKAAGMTVPCAPVPPCSFTLRKFTAGANPVRLVTNVSGAPSCAPTKMYWETEGAEHVFFEGREVPPNASLQVCINQTTTYTLRMVCNGESRTSRYTLNFESVVNK